MWEIVYILSGVVGDDAHRGYGRINAMRLKISVFRKKMSLHSRCE